MSPARGSNARPTPRFALSIAVPLVFVALLSAALDPRLRPQRFSADFNAFYCAGAAIRAQADPYRAEPLGACERRTLSPQIVHVARGVSMPAPLPPYALVPFALLAGLPYLSAFALWSVGIAFATAVALHAARQLTGLPFVALAAGFALGTLSALELGQVAPFATAAIALSAALVRRRRDVCAAVAAACATIEPHVALPACLALFCWFPKTRLPLACAASAGLLLSCALVGPTVALEYVREVLPAHALSEVANQQQLSLTYVLHRFGVAPLASVRAGEWWYGAMLVLGVALAGRFAACKPELVPSLPIVFALFGGAFVHAVQMPAALPGALVLATDSTSAVTRRVLAAAVLLLALPFVQFATLWPCSIPLYGAAAAVLGATLLETPLWPTLLLAAAATSIPLASWAGLHFTEQPSLAALVSRYDPRALADESWRRYMELIAATSPLQLNVLKIPMWIGLATILWAGARRAFRAPLWAATPPGPKPGAARYTPAPR